MRPGETVTALCADGIVRKARILSDADTFYSVPARVSVKGRTVTGFVWYETTTDDRPELPRFTPNAWLANASALPGWDA